MILIELNVINPRVERLIEEFNDDYVVDVSALESIRWDVVRNPPANPSELTVLSMGAGQDSTTILNLLIRSEEVRNYYAPGHLVVIMSNTNNEHPSTYAHIERVRKLCEENSIEFNFITSDDGYHYKKWPGLKEFYNRTRTVGSKAFIKTCTDKLKIQPIYKFLEDYIADRYGLSRGRKKAYLEFAERFGKIKMLIGIAKGEESRVAKRGPHEPKWRQASIDIAYPLLDLGMDRHACQSWLASIGQPIPLPSNCMICPFLSKKELLWLERFYPHEYEDWVRIEMNKIHNPKYAHLDPSRNLGVWGRKLLPEVLAEARAEYGDISDKDLHEYKMSHGHCVKSKY